MEAGATSTSLELFFNQAAWLTAEQDPEKRFRLSGRAKGSSGLRILAGSLYLQVMSGNESWNCTQ